MTAPISKAELYEKLVETLVDTFGLEAARIVPTAKLYDDLDIDSIDAVDLIVRMKPLVGGRRMSPDAFKQVRTVQDVVDALYGLLSNEAPVPGVAEKAPAVSTDK